MKIKIKDRGKPEGYTFDVEIIVEGEKSRYFTLFYDYPDESGYSEKKLVKITDEDYSELIHFRDDFYYSQNTYTLETATQTKKIIIDSIEFVKSEVKEAINIGVSEKKIDVIYKKIEYLNEILKYVNEKIFEEESRKKALLKKYNLD